MERSLHFKGSGKFGQNSIFQTFSIKKLNNEKYNGFVLHQNLDLPGKSHYNHSSNLNKGINYAVTIFNPSINKYLNKEPWITKSTTSSFSLSTALKFKVTRSSISNFKQSNLLRSKLIFDTSRTKSFINPRN